MIILVFPGLVISGSYGTATLGAQKYVYPSKGGIYNGYFMQLTVVYMEDIFKALKTGIYDGLSMYSYGKEKIGQGKVGEGTIDEGTIAKGKVDEGKIAKGKIAEGKIAKRKVAEGKVGKRKIGQGKDSQRGETKKDMVI